MSAAASNHPLLAGLFASIDARDTSGFLEHIAPDATFRFGSAPAVSGHDAIGDAVGGFFASIAGLRHRLEKTLADGSTLICAGEVTYERHDGQSVKLPFANVFEVQDNLISDYRIYIDIAPLYAD